MYYYLRLNGHWRTNKELKSERQVGQVIIYNYIVAHHQFRSW
jgi:hypothetical protein